MGGPLAARAGAQVHVHKMEFVSGWMRKFQSEEDEKGWSLLVGVSKNLSDMIKTLEELHQEEDIRGVFKTISSLVSSVTCTITASFYQSCRIGIFLAV